MFDLLFIKVINALYSDSGSVNKLFHTVVLSCIRSPQTVIMTPDDYSPELQLLAWCLSKEVYKQINLSAGTSASISGKYPKCLFNNPPHSLWTQNLS